MKNYLLTILCFLIVTFNALSTEKTNIGIIDDEFYKSEFTVVSIRALIPHDTKIIAVVDGSSNHDIRTMTVEPLFSRSWVFHDGRLCEQEKIHATVICGSKIVEKDILRENEVPYLFLKESEQRTGELLPGRTIEVLKTREYTRPSDGSLFRKVEGALYSLEMKRVVVYIGEESVCNREKNIISQWEKKLRHWCHFYDASDVYHITYKTMLTGGLKLTPSEPEEIEKILITRELKIKRSDQEGPHCGSLGRSVTGNRTFI